MWHSLRITKCKLHTRIIQWIHHDMCLDLTQPRKQQPTETSLCSPLNLCLLGLSLMYDVAVFFSGLAHARSGNAFKQTLNLLRTMSEVVSPKVVARVFDKLDEGDEQAPWMWPVDNQPLQQYPCDLLLHNLLQSQNVKEMANCNMNSQHTPQSHSRRQHMIYIKPSNLNTKPVSWEALSAAWQPTRSGRLASDLWRLVEEVEQDAGEVVGVIVGVAQLVGQGVQEEVAPLCVHVSSQAHEDVQGGLVHGAALWPRLVQIYGLQTTT